MGEGKGGGDNDWDIEAFLFPLTPPLSRKGRGSFRMNTGESDAEGIILGRFIMRAFP
jgi:hypothetical protein